MMKKFAKWLAVLLMICLMLTACTPAGTAGGGSETVYSQETQNLEKLCKVWGYVKYTHPVFLTGEKDWDAELIALIPQVRQAENSEETNKILNEWLLSLGEIKYKTDETTALWSSAKEEDKVVIADTSWVFDQEYLGEELSANMEPLTKPLPDINRFNAPIDFSRYYYTGYNQPTMFCNEKLYEDMDYSDENYRLLGLFRVWNAMEYYYPYLDILDEDWEDLLPDFILQMLEGSDQHSYDLIIAALTAKLQDAHVAFGGSSEFIKKEFGEYLISDVEFVSAEGEIVVLQTFDESCPLQPGDIIRKLDGVDIEDRVEHCKKYISVTTDEKIKNPLQLPLLRSHSKTPEVTVIRDGKEMTFNVNADEFQYSGPRYGVSFQDGEPKPYEIIEGNIGVINPAFMNLQSGAVHGNEVKWAEAMNALKDTDGLIVDYRQYPANSWQHLPPYLFEEAEVGLLTASISEAVPGTFIKEPVFNFNTKPRSAYRYDKEVVVLIDEHSQSASEYAAMLVQNGEKVTLMGENTIGSNGFCLILPIPGGNMVMHTAQGIYTPDGGQTQRIGVSPDIEVKKTIEGIKEGRDEVKEAAIAYIQEQSQSATVAE